MKRETGFYWVLYENDWIIGYFNHYDKHEEQYWWTLPEDWDAGNLEDRNFEEINEQKITHKTEIMKCKKCNISMIESKALDDIYVGGIDSNNPPQLGDTLIKSGKAKLIDVLKCPECGYSVSK